MRTALALVGAVLVGAKARDLSIITVAAHGAQPVGAWLRPAAPARAQTLQAQLAPPGGKVDLRYDVPIDTELILRVWSRGDPGGACEVTLLRERLVQP